jgi:nucleoside diphosphate kinase
VERTLIIVKPDAVQRGLIGEIIRRFETRGLKNRRHEADAGQPLPGRKT